jgi:1-deoxy-D-xylulose 5-phosphate reductoisomerase
MLDSYTGVIDWHSNQPKPIEETRMNTVLSNNRNANLYSIGASALVLIVLFGMVVAPSITISGTSIIPVTGSENAYFQFLSGEKAIYASPAGMNEALAAYHLGEKAVYANAVDASGALLTYHLGEKVLYTSLGAANALSVWSFGEKAIVGSASLESALSAWRQGEKDAR